MTAQSLLGGAIFCCVVGIAVCLEVQSEFAFGLPPPFA